MVLGIDTGAIFNPKVFAMLAFGLTIIAFLAAIAALGFLFYYIKSYNISIEYFDKRKHINRLRRTKAKKFIQDGIPKLKVWMVKGAPLKLPDTNIVFKVGNRDKIFMTRDFAGNWNFVEWNKESEAEVFKEVSPEARLWESLQYRKNIQRFQKQSFWEKYGNLIIQYGFIIIVVFMLILLFTKFKVVADTLNAAIQAAQECQRL